MTWNQERAPEKEGLQRIEGERSGGGERTGVEIFVKRGA